MLSFYIHLMLDLLSFLTNYHKNDVLDSTVFIPIHNN